MKLSCYVKIAILAVTLVFTSCRTHKTVVQEPKPAAPDSAEQVDFLQKVQSHHVSAQFVTSKLKFTVEYGPQKISLTGNLKMKRDDVIRLQLMAFGFVEAGRLEFTPDYVLIMDRINKQYLKAPYNYVDFLRNSGINFHTLQALFWNELFVPGKQDVDSTMFNRFDAALGNEDVVITLDEGKMSYSWLANEHSGRIRMANISFRDQYKGNTQLNWDYREFTQMGPKLFPNNMNVTLTTPEKEVSLEMKLNYRENDSDWETRTAISDKYREVTVDEILKRFMAL